jgi:uncharacterized protein
LLLLGTGKQKRAAHAQTLAKLESAALGRAT